MANGTFLVSLDSLQDAYDPGRRDFRGARLETMGSGSSPLRLKRCDFSRSIWVGGIPDKSVLLGCDFSDTDMTSFDFGKSTLEACTFDGADLSSAMFGASTLSLCTFKRAWLFWALLDDADLTGCPDLFDAGKDDRGWNFFGQNFSNTAVRIQ